MFRHTLLLIFRNFKRFKSTFFINLIGLSTGMACAILIYLWVNDELLFDKFHKKNNQLYQVWQNETTSSGIQTSAPTPFPLADALALEMPEVELSAVVTPLAWFPKFIVTANNKHMKHEGKFVGKDFFKIFSYTLLKGNENQVLSDLHSIAISERLAMQLFNTTDNILGKTIEWQLSDIKKESVISGIFEDTPSHSSDQFDLVMPFEAFEKIMQIDKDDFNGNGPNTYLVLKEGTNINSFNNKITAFLKRKSSNAKNRSLMVTNYSENYLYGVFENGVRIGGRIEYLKLFTLIAIFILSIACINFINLSTAKASRRIKEVGIKKAIGAGRGTLIFQYLCESMLMSFLSLLLAFLIVDLSLNQFNDITGKHLYLSFDGNMILSAVIITLLTGFASGSYPALYLSGFNPALVLKGKLNTSVSELLARKGLVIFQFTISVIFIVSVVVIYKQIQFVQAKHPGYDKDNVIYFEAEGKIATDSDTFISKLKETSGIVNASSYTFHLIADYGKGKEIIVNQNPISFGRVVVNYGFIETLGIKMAAGRPYSRDFADSTTIIFNEAAIEAMGIDDPIGKVIDFDGSRVEIVGVTKNFHFESLHQKVKPMYFTLDLGRQWNIIAKLNSGLEKETLAAIEKIYHEYNPGYIFDYKFLDQDYQAQYVSEQRVATLSRYFAGLAILISCLGLFGLAAFTAERRLKEIGIRKVLGASELGIVFLLSSDFTKIVFTSIVIALPLSFFITQYWLDSFAYKIPLSWWYFIGAGLMALVIAWLTVGTQAIKAARINPTRCLKDE